MINKNRWILFIAFVLVCCAGCSKNSDAYEGQLPDIVFIYYENNSQLRDSINEIPDVMFFLDKNGNEYVTSDPDVTCLSFKELLEKYSQGNLDGNIELRTSWDSSAIEDNYRKLRKTALNEDVSLEYSETVLDVLRTVETLYGVIYGNDGNLEYIPLHSYGDFGIAYSKNDIVNSIYKWYIEMSK